MNLTRDVNDLVAWLRREIEADRDHANLISAGGFVPQRWDTEPPGQVNPEKVAYAAELDRILVPDEEDRMLRPGPVGYWTEVVAYGRMNTEPPGADCRGSDLPVMLVNNGRREASHVIRHDPRWAVADCEAKLAILDEHRSFDPASDWLGGFCATCGEVDHRRVAWPCRTVRLLGSGYRHRPGYREEWKP